MAQVEWYNPETGQVELIDDGQGEIPLSPWEQAHGNVPYDPSNQTPTPSNQTPPGGPSGGGPTEAQLTAGYIHDPALNEAWRNQSLQGQYPNEGGADSSLGEWAGIGVNPATQMFDSRGQLLPGWERTADGYRYQGQGPSSGISRGSGGGFSMGPLLQPYGGSFKKPEFGTAARQLMDLIGPAPEYTAPEIPTIAPYTPTTSADVLGDPSFGFRKDIGEKALLNNRAAQGLVRTGGTLKDLLDYNQNFATTEYGNVDARRFRDYSTGVDNTFRRSGMEQERARSMYEPKLFEWTKKGDLSAKAEGDAYDNAWNEFMGDYNIWRNQQNDVFDRLKWSSEFGLDAATR